MRLLHWGKLHYKVLLMLGIISLCIVLFAGTILYRSMEIEQDFHHIIEIKMTEHAASADMDPGEIDRIMATELKIDAQVNWIWQSVLVLISLIIISGWLFARYEIIAPSSS